MGIELFWLQKEFFFLQLRGEMNSEIAFWGPLGVSKLNLGALSRR